MTQEAETKTKDANGSRARPSNPAKEAKPPAWQRYKKEADDLRSKNETLAKHNQALQEETQQLRATIGLLESRTVNLLQDIRAYPGLVKPTPKPEEEASEPDE